MGAIYSPSYAHILMYHFEWKFINHLIYLKFIDHVFFIWTGKKTCSEVSEPTKYKATINDIWVQNTKGKILFLDTEDKLSNLSQHKFRASKIVKNSSIPWSQILLIKRIQSTKKYFDQISWSKVRFLK